MADYSGLVKNPEAWAELEHDDPRLDAFAHDVEDRYGLPRGVIEALKNAGERTPAKASGKPTVSPKGAKGVMQFMDATRSAFQHNPDDPFESIDAAGRYMAELVQSQQGNVMAAIAWYNGGSPAAAAVRNGREPPAQETRDYLARIRQYMNKRYGGSK